MVDYFIGHHHHHLPPKWIQPLLTEKFFNACLIHDQFKKNEKNIFCFHCCQGICTHCSPLHHSHRLLQIRRYVYHNVVRIEDVQKLIDCTLVQGYTTNNLKVVFLNHRPQITRTFRGAGSSCITCDRALQDPFLFCSISCKIHHMLITTDESNFVTLLETGFEDEQLTPHSVLEVVGETRSSNSSRSSCGGIASAPAEVVRKKRSSVPALRAAAAAACRKIDSSPVTVTAGGGVEIMKSRRKGMPQRSPFF